MKDIAIVEEVTGNLLGEIKIEPGKKAIIQWDNQTNPPRPIEICIETLPDGTVYVRTYMSAPGSLDPHEGNIVAFPTPAKDEDNAGE
ncbi:MAG: hypothetical protein RBU21_12190 [FCB group bacterium]|jgi:hypothetical protein|nr:hypothetical protein [FCB group bacterium]